METNVIKKFIVQGSWFKVAGKNSIPPVAAVDDF